VRATGRGRGVNTRPDPLARLGAWVRMGRQNQLQCAHRANRLAGSVVVERFGRCDHVAVSERAKPNVDVIDLAPGLWIWRLEHPEWKEQCEWQEVVTGTCVDAGDERWLLDPLLPPADATEFWARLAERPPTAVALLIPDHADRMSWGDRQVGSVDTVVGRYGCRAFGPDDWSENRPPETELEKIVPGEALPGGLVPFRDPRGWSETPLYLPEQKTVVFGDALTERGGVLRIWGTPHMERACSDLRAMLDLPFERLIILMVNPCMPATRLSGRSTCPAGPPRLRSTMPPGKASSTASDSSSTRALT